MVMRHKSKMSSHEPITLIDRLGMAFLSGLIAFLSAGFLWLALAGLNRAGTQIVILPKWPVNQRPIFSSSSVGIADH